MTEERAIYEWQKLLDSKQTVLVYRNALAGDGGGTVNVTGEPGYIWCRYSSDQSKVSKVFNIVAPGIPEDFPIVVGRRFPTDEFEQVLAVNWTLYQDTVTQDTVDSFTVGKHGESHNAESTDPVPVDLRNIVEMRARAQATPDLTIHVERGQYVFGYNDVKQFPGGNLDLTASVPAGAGHMYSLVYIDGATNTLANDDSITVPLAATPPIPDITQNTIPICIVDLSNGQTTITEDSIYDYRFMWDLVTWNAPWLIGTNADRLALVVGDLAELTHFCETDTDQIWQVWEGAWRIVYPPSKLTAPDGSPDSVWYLNNDGTLIGDDNVNESPHIRLVNQSNTYADIYVEDLAGNGQLSFLIPGNSSSEDFRIYNTDPRNMWELDGVGYLIHIYDDDGTTGVDYMLLMNRQTGNVAANGFGLGILFKLESGGGSQRDAGSIEIIWTDATNTSEDSEMEFHLNLAGGGLTEILTLSFAESVYNEDGEDTNFRFESANQTHMLFIDAGFDSVLINGSTDLSSTMGITTTAAADKGLVIRGSGSQTANLQEWQNSGGSILLSVDADGRSVFTTAASGSTTAGALWRDSTQKALQSYLDSIEQTLSAVIFVQTASKTVANTTTETTLNSTGVGSLSLPTNFFVIGKKIRIVARGYRSTANPSGTLRIRVKLGATTILDTTALTATNGLTNRAWELNGVIVCRTTGAAGTVMAQGRCHMAQTTTTANFWEMLNTSTIVIDTTAAQAITVTAQWGTADASNTITCSNLSTEVLN